MIKNSINYFESILFSISDMFCCYGNKNIQLLTSTFNSRTGDLSENILYCIYNSYSKYFAKIGNILVVKGLILWVFSNVNDED